jgi:hypothetical protein
MKESVSRQNQRRSCDDGNRGLSAVTAGFEDRRRIGVASIKQKRQGVDSLLDFPKEHRTKSCQLLLLFQ